MLLLNYSALPRNSQSAGNPVQVLQADVGDLMGAATTFRSCEAQRHKTFSLITEAGSEVEQALLYLLAGGWGTPASFLPGGLADEAGAARELLAEICCAFTLQVC